MKPINDSFFADRLAALRIRKNVSAREMSLALGENPSYINRIENRQVYPSVQGFFTFVNICRSARRVFFSEDLPDPVELRELKECLRTLSEKRLELLLALAREMAQ